MHLIKRALRPLTGPPSVSPRGPKAPGDLPKGGRPLKQVPPLMLKLASGIGIQKPRRQADRTAGLWSHLLNYQLYYINLNNV